MQQIVWGVFFVVCVALGLREVSRWRDPALAAVITAGHKRRRSIGLALLIAISVMGYRSADMPTRHITTLQANEEVVYYGVMALLVLAVLVIAYHEWKTTLLHASTERSKAIESVIRDLTGLEGPDGKLQ